jgi:hypothetical protein
MNYFLLIVLIHFLADFALQTHDQAIGKGVGTHWFNIDLLKHVLNYSLVWGVFILAVYNNFWIAIGFFIITFIAHYITDFITSRLSKPLFESKDFHNGFVVVGADQVAHYVQLYYTFYLLNLVA